MRPTDFRPGGGDSTDRPNGDDCLISSFTMDGETVLFDVDDAKRWIRSDTALDPARVA